jgi:hypothetical protein
MDFGIGIATSSDSWKLAQRAEELGFTHQLRRTCAALTRLEITTGPPPASDPTVAPIAPPLAIRPSVSISLGQDLRRRCGATALTFQALAHRETAAPLREGPRVRIQLPPAASPLRTRVFVRDGSRTRQARLCR